MNVPEDLQYAPTHEWLRLDGETGTVGITDHAQAELTDVVYVELPKVGAQVTARQQVCVIESVKAASDIYSPISGTITAVNEALTGSPAPSEHRSVRRGMDLQDQDRGRGGNRDAEKPGAISGADRRSGERRMTNDRMTNR